MAKYCFGVDVGGTTVKLGCFDTEGTLLEKWEIHTRTENSGEAILPDVADSILDKMKEREIAREDVVGVGIGAPGPIDGEGTVYNAVNLGWGTFSIKNRLQSLLNIPVEAGNDANVAALGEMWKGGGQGHKNLVAVTLGTGVGGGIIADGKILSGTTGAAGEIGHIHVMEGEKEACNCGGHGCLEQVASATGIARTARRMLAADNRPSTLRSLKNISAKNVLDAAKAGDALALESLNKSCYYLGWALATISMVLDPQAFLIGGGVSKAGTFLTDIIKRYHDELSPMATKKADIVLAKLGNDAGIYGAAKLIIG
mgnify:CR=1 FL=1